MIDKSHLKRWISQVLVIGLVATGLAACSNESDPPDGGDDGLGTIRLQLEASKLAGFEAVVEMFTAQNPGSEVVLETITSDQKATTNGLTLAGGDAPDLGLAPINAASYSQLLYGDALLPLDDVWETANLETRYDESTVDSLAPDGSVPYTVVPEKQLYNIVYYNVSMFDDLGIEIPEDRMLRSDEELVAIADSLRGAGKEPLCIGGTSNYQFGWLFDGQLSSVASPELLNAYLASGQPGVEDVDYAAGDVVTALEALEGWYEAGIFQTGVLGQNYDVALANFVAETCGSLLGTATTVGALESNDAQFEVNWFLLPGAGGPILPSTYTGSTLVVPKTAANPEGAKRFLEFLMTPEAQLAYVSGNGTLPAVNDLSSDDLVEALPDLVNSVLDFTAQEGAALGWTSVVPGEMGQGFIDPAIQRMLNGESSPQETAEQLQQNYLSYRENADG